MKERPILFSGPMVRAILDGRKTQTRRVMNFQPPSDKHVLGRVMSTTGDRRIVDKAHWLIYEDYAVIDSDENYFDCPFGKPGDRLWVRETWATSANVRPRISEPYIYRSDRNERGLAKWSATWKSPIHMPRIASRITLEVVSVRVERLLNLTNTDALAEGILPMEGNCGFSWADGKPTEMPICECCDRPVERFAELWDKINGKRHPWSENPWVWVIEFKKVEATESI